MLFLTLASVNKPINLHYFLFMHTHFLFMHTHFLGLFLHFFSSSSVSVSFPWLFFVFSLLVLVLCFFLSSSVFVHLLFSLCSSVRREKGWRTRGRGWRSCIGWPMPLRFYHVFFSNFFSWFFLLFFRLSPSRLVSSFVVLGRYW